MSLMVTEVGGEATLTPVIRTVATRLSAFCNVAVALALGALTIA